ncbi:hypothetical protein [Mangrovimonas cancribranchiae]|uniref:Lipocalin-like domain-containing protein n=1 Tax=Mangrovimonas cancribranchiae TaxID=3080055 RepID=A0AAU6NXL0_9FLAO
MEIRLLFLFMIFFSCNIDNKKDVLNKLEGQWFIDEIKYNGVSYKDYLYSNVLVLKEDSKISIPETLHFEKDKTSTWEVSIIENRIMLSIKSSNLAFKDNYNLTFMIDNKERRAMVLKSDSIYIKAHKFMLNHDNW